MLSFKTNFITCEGYSTIRELALNRHQEDLEEDCSRKVEKKHSPKEFSINGLYNSEVDADQFWRFFGRGGVNLWYTYNQISGLDSGLVCE